MDSERKVSGEGTLTSGPYGIEPAWIDYNGHLNMAYYLVLFDRGIDALMAAAGIVPRCEADPTLFAAEAKLRYLDEVRADDELTCETSVLRVDAKRLHSWQSLRRRDGRIAATCENLHLSVARADGVARVAPFASPAYDALVARVRGKSWPEGAGEAVALRGFAGASGPPAEARNAR